MRRRPGLLMTLMALSAGCFAGVVHANDERAVPDVIPAPAQVRLATGMFAVRAGTPLSIPREPGAARAARYFRDLLANTRGVRLNSIDAPHKVPPSGGIVFQLTPKAASNPESYQLEIDQDRIVASASDPRGLLYAAVTLWQLCTSQTAESSAVDTDIRVPALRIEDTPRFRWRGLMLDSARHYQSPQFILQLIDWMALHKLNVLQWHLTDDQGWRLQIRKYPRLTAVGAWRVEAGAAHAADVDPATGHPRLYGGFYTQDAVREIVAHAARRNVTIVPEIDMPGHATAAIVAYPQLGTVQPAPTAVPSDWGVYGNLYNAQEQTFQFLEDVLGEVVQLFPGRYIHVGGDEAVKGQWRASPQIQQRMRELGVANEEALQSYFVRRMERFLARHGRRLIGWDEILQGGIAPRATVMSWRGIDGAVTAATAGHDTVLSPDPILYFDNMQGNLPDEPPGRGHLISLEDVYHFDPLPGSLSVEQQRHVLGLQANLWSEHIRTEDRLQYMTFPRAAAVAEVGWSPATRILWNSFVTRLPSEMRRYQMLGVHASDDALAVDIQATLDRSQAQLELSTQTGLGDIHYTLDGSEPVATSLAYSTPLVTDAHGEIRAAAFLGSARLASVRERALDVSSLQTRTSHQLRSCSSKLLLSLEDDAPLEGERAVFWVDIMNPCWIYTAADLTHVTAVVATVGQLPFNFQLGDDVHAIRLLPPQTPSGELEVRLDGCEGELIARLSLAPALGNQGVTQLPADSIGSHAGRHDLCLRFTRQALDPIWVIDRIRLLE